MPETDENCLCIEIIEPISIEAYRDLYFPIMQKIIREKGEINILVYYRNFKGWEKDAAMFDLGAGTILRPHIKKLASVNIPESEKNRSTLLVQSTMQIRFFEESELQDAIKWIKE